MTQVPYDQLPRKERLLIWLRYHGLTYQAIADAIGAPKSSISTWFSAESIPILRRRRLEAFGIPGDLLPPGINLRSGPRSRAKSGVVLALPPAPADAHPATDTTPAAR